MLAPKQQSFLRSPAVTQERQKLRILANAIRAQIALKPFNGGLKWKPRPPQEFR